ncbi:M1 family metallopeptidase [Catellatospora sp. KI3]|uniref:M1 family metallopeptidase n=1 Tax=Catellatospora sp. KI3 TaxID=3041620 RepID=UPI0024829BB2|nr:M1 family metallopeptidase [Catellatospora sp. KI3]MDI1463696.1 M1 family metallopeptidase [Catellatospora sp. KI3]
MAMRRWMAGATAVALLAGCGSPATKPLFTADPRLPAPETAGFDPAGLGDDYFPTAGNGGYDVSSYDLNLRYDPATGRLDGTAAITATTARDLTAFHLDLHGLTVTRADVDGTAATTGHDGDELVVTPATPLTTGQTFVTTIGYGGTPSPIEDRRFGSGGFFRTRDGAVAMGEPASASTWFPVNDHPRDKAHYTIEVTVPDGLAAISNGVPAGTSSKGGWTGWRWEVTAPMAPYLAMLAIGKYRVTTGEHDGRPLVTAVADTVRGDDAQQALARTPEITDFLAQWFGPYPFDAYGGVVVDDERIDEALETQTRPIYPASTFRRGPDTVTVAHELAHQWFGDSVSLTRWRDIWLNEGFATYAEWMWQEHEGDGTVRERFDRLYRHDDSRIWSVPPGDPGRGGLFSDSVYQRGAMTLHALREQVGDDTFFAILRTWATAHRDGNATTGDFTNLAEKLAGRPLGGFFDAWLYQTGRPAM